MRDNVRLVRVAVTKVLGCFFRAVGADTSLRLRLGVGLRGDELFPTDAEHERAEKEHERGEKERLRTESARARQDLEREVERLRAELSARKRRPRARR